MRFLSRWPGLLCGIALVSLASPAADAQPEGEDVLFEVAVPPPGDDAIAMAGYHHLKVLSFEEGFETKLVKGAPYQAEAVTEVVHTLADGNRIVRKTTAMVARDSEGRTRRETSVAAIGPLAPAGAPPRTVFLSDPVAGTRYVLELDERVARKLPPAPELIHAKAAKAGGPPDRVVFMHGTAGRDGKAIRETITAGKAESLGTQVIEGVEAEGTRTRVVIPAGEIGNERSLEIVSERWYSPELQAVVLSRHSDPRHGETTYRLLSISRGEPDRALFEVPADFTVSDAPIHKRFHKRLQLREEQAREP